VRDLIIGTTILTIGAFLLGGLLTLQLACASNDDATNLALCEAGCNYAQLGGAYGCNEIPDKYADERNLCLAGAVVMDPVCKAGCAEKWGEE
jgi:hypothetical protein